MSLYDAQPLSFEDWYRAVDRVVIAHAGIGIDDLADGPSRDAYDDLATPEEYAIDRLYAEGFPFPD